MYTFASHILQHCTAELIINYLLISKRSQPAILDKLNKRLWGSLTKGFRKYDVLLGETHPMSLRLALVAGACQGDPTHCLCHGLTHTKYKKRRSMMASRECKERVEHATANEPQLQPTTERAILLRTMRLENGLPTHVTCKQRATWCRSQAHPRSAHDLSVFEAKTLFYCIFFY